MILFICTGNTCRSPLAAALAKSRGVDAQSAGLMAWPGSPATDEAIRAAAHHGGDLKSHRARPVTEELLKQADKVWVMTPEHWSALNQCFPEYAYKVDVLAPAIPDPYGGDDAVYERCAARLIEAMKRAGIFKD
ncbi:MAG: low molecular weight protein arginine phosphatase [Clostridia bacterium]|nr:low molecular weight protein arginine phosphatase [Clostridia bacterium]